MVFAAVGITLPDNFPSLSQGRQIIKKFGTDEKPGRKKAAVLKLAQGGAAILCHDTTRLCFILRLDIQPFCYP